MSEKIKVVISDCHLSAGRYYKGRFNPHEDFFFDQEMVDFVEYFSSGEYGEGPFGAVDVELVINGDFLDFLNVPYLGEFEEGVTEEIALVKLEAILSAHKSVMHAFKKFAAKPNKRITYLIGNHDADLFFPRVQERITREWDPEGEYPSAKVKVIADTDRISYEDGLEIRHGNQFEAVNQLDFQNPMVELSNGTRVLNIPWGSIYVLKIINRLKRERSNIDKIRPMKVYAILGLVFDPIFMVRFMMLSMFYFFKSRIQSHHSKLFGFRNFIQLMGQERNYFLDLDQQARQLLSENPTVKTVVFGHTHLPMHHVYSNGKEYLNTGTWTKMVYLDWRFLGEPFRKTFALIKIKDGKIHSELNQWSGQKMPYQSYLGG